MKVRKYRLHFTTDDEYVIYFWALDSFISFPAGQKKMVDEVISSPDRLDSPEKQEVYQTLASRNALIEPAFSEIAEVTPLRYRDIYRRGGELNLTLLPTMFCNFDCEYCFESKRSERMSDEVFNNIVRYIYREHKRFDNIFINWFGGEPLLELERVEALNSFCRDLEAGGGAGFDSILTTNGSLLTPEVSERLMKSGLTHINVTFDGSESTHDEKKNLPGSKGSFQLIDHNVKSFLGLSPENRAILRVHLHKTEPRELQAVLDYISSYEEFKEQIHIYFRFIFSIDSGQWENELPCFMRHDEKSDRRQILTYLYDELVKRGFTPYYRNSKTAYCHFEGENSWTVSPKGECVQCLGGCEMAPAIARVGSEGIELDNRAYNSYRTKDDPATLAVCADCSKFTFCWGGCQLLRARRAAKDSGEFQCQMGKAPLSEEHLPTEAFLESFLFHKHRYIASKRDKE